MICVLLHLLLILDHSYLSQLQIKSFLQLLPTANNFVPKEVKQVQPGLQNNRPNHRLQSQDERTRKQARPVVDKAAILIGHPRTITRF